MEAEHIVQRRAAYGEDDPQQGAGPAASCVAHPADDHADEVGEKGKIVRIRMGQTESHGE